MTNVLNSRIDYICDCVSKIWKYPTNNQNIYILLHAIYILIIK